MATNKRKVTYKILDMIEEGLLDPRDIAEACLVYMSEANVVDMTRCNDLDLNFEEEEEG